MDSDLGGLFNGNGSTPLSSGLTSTGTSATATTATVRSGGVEGVVIPNVNAISVSATTPVGGSFATVAHDRDTTLPGTLQTASTIVPSIVDAPPVSVGTVETIYAKGNSVLLAYTQRYGGFNHQYSNFGLAFTLTGNQLSVAGFHSGEAPPSMPTTGTAEYNGSWTGRRYLVGTGDPVGVWGGSIRTSVNFADGTVSSQMDVANNIEDPNRTSLNREDFGIQLDGTIVGNQHAGTAKFIGFDTATRTFSGDVGTVTSSSSSGAFYGPRFFIGNGPNGTETVPIEHAGAFRIEGNPDGNTPMVIVGAVNGKNN